MRTEAMLTLTDPAIQQPDEFPKNKQKIAEEFWLEWKNFIVTKLNSPQQNRGDTHELQIKSFQSNKINIAVSRLG